MRRLLFSIILASVACLATAAHAQDFEAAGKHFSTAQEAFGARRYKTAAVEFEAAYAISKDPVLLYNIGESYEKAGDGHKAVTSYKEYLKDQPQAADKAEVNRRIHAIESKRYRLVDQSAPEDRPATAAGTTAPIAPTPAVAATPAPDAPAAGATSPALAPQTTDGPRPLTATPPPGSAAPQPTATPTPSTPASTAPNTSALPPATAAPPSTPTPEQAARAPEPAQVAPPPVPAPPPGLIDEGPPTRLRVAAWIGVASTLALLTAGAVFGLAAQSRGDEITRQLAFVGQSGQPNQYNSSTAATLDQYKSDGHLYNGLAIGFFSASAASAVATVVMFVVDAKHPHPAKHALRLGPSLGHDAAGLSLQGAF